MPVRCQQQDYFNAKYVIEIVCGELSEGTGLRWCLYKVLVDTVIAN